jgi:hypothetical protein
MILSVETLLVALTQDHPRAVSTNPLDWHRKIFIYIFN